MDMNLGKLGEVVGTGEAWSAVVRGVTKTGLGRQDWAAEQQLQKAAEGRNECI